MRDLLAHLMLAVSIVLAFQLAPAVAPTLAQESDLTRLCQDPGFRDAVGPALASTLEYPLPMPSADACVRILTTSVMVDPGLRSFSIVCAAPELRVYFPTVDQCVEFFYNIDT